MGRHGLAGEAAGGGCQEVGQISEARQGRAADQLLYELHHRDAGRVLPAAGIGYRAVLRSRTLEKKTGKKQGHRQDRAILKIKRLFQKCVYLKKKSPIKSLISHGFSLNFYKKFYIL